MLIDEGADNGVDNGIHYTHNQKHGRNNFGGQPIDIGVEKQQITADRSVDEVAG